MNRKALFVAPLVILYIAVPIRAQQMTTNPSGWMEQEGLAVASTQQVTTRPTKLRLFTTLTVRDKDARRAVSSLAEKKKSVKDGLQSLGVKPSVVTISPIRILDWNSGASGTGGGFFSVGDTDPMHVPNRQPLLYTAYAAVQVDWEIKQQTSDELILMPIDLIGQIREAGPFDVDRTDQAWSDHFAVASEIYMLFVGDISEEASTDATKRAYDEANAQAIKLAATTNRTLGKLVTMSPRVDGYSFYHWNYQYATRYRFMGGFGGMGGMGVKGLVVPHPMSQFGPLPSEVYSSNPDDLQRTYSIDLRFELE